MIDISPGFGVFLMMNNYFHDVATALMAASGIVLWLLVKRYDATDEATSEFFGRLYSGMVKLGRFTLIWILLGGVPRVFYFRRFEFKNALDHSQVPSLIIKHLLALLFVGLGAWLWARYSQRAVSIINASQAKED